MIIVEGPDGGGKTTLLQSIVRMTGLEPEKRVVDKDTKPLAPLRDWVIGDLMSWPRAALYDRHRLISEPIYSPAMRRLPNDGFEDYDWLEQVYGMFYSHCPVIIYCLPPFSEVDKNCKRDPDNRTIYPHLRQIYDLYCFQAARDASHNGYFSVRWDYTNDDLDNFLKLLKTLLVNPIRGRKGMYNELLSQLA